MTSKAFLSRFLENLSNIFIRCDLFILMHFLYFSSEQYSYKESLNAQEWFSPAKYLGNVI